MMKYNKTIDFIFTMSTMMYLGEMAGVCMFHTSNKICEFNQGLLIATASIFSLCFIIRVIQSLKIQLKELNRLMKAFKSITNTK